MISAIALAGRRQGRRRGVLRTRSRTGATLFSPLLPAHILKDSPGGWAAALDTGIPVSANRYKMRLGGPRSPARSPWQRNDKYWAGVSGPATVVVRMGDSPDLLAALERGDLEAVQIRPSAAEQPTVDAIPPDRRVRVPEPGTVQLVMNTGAGPTVDPAIRRAVVAALGQETVIAALEGAPAAEPESGGSGVRGAGVLDDLAAVHHGGPPGVGGNGRLRPDAASAELGGRRLHAISGVYVTKDGRPLAMRLALPEQRMRDSPPPLGSSRLNWAGRNPGGSCRGRYPTVGDSGR